MYTIYGIKNCDTMKKALAYLKDKALDYHFVDFKKQSPSVEDLQRWQAGFGELPVNKRGTTYRKIKAEYEGASPSEQIELLRAQPSAIKRPILEGPETLLRGFDAEQWP